MIILFSVALMVGGCLDVMPCSSNKGMAENRPYDGPTV